MEGWNIYGKGNTRNTDYTEKGEGTHTGGGRTYLGEGDIHGKETTWNGN